MTSDLIQYKTDAGKIGTIERDGTLIILDPAADYVDITVVLDPAVDKNLNRAWYLDQPNFNGYNLSGQYGFRISKSDLVDPFGTPGEYQILSGVGRRLDYILNGQFSYVETGLSFRIMFSETVILPDEDDSDNIIGFNQTSRIDVDQLYAGFISADSACIRILNCVESADIQNLSGRNHVVDNSRIGELYAHEATIPDLTSERISAESLIIGNYYYEPDAGVRYKESDGDNNRYIKFNPENEEWDIVPRISVEGINFNTILNGDMKFEARSTGWRTLDRLQGPISDTTVGIVDYDHSSLKINEEFVYDNQARGLTLTIIDHTEALPDIRIGEIKGKGRVIFSQNYDTFSDQNASNALAFKMNRMRWGQVGIITSRFGYEPNLTRGLKALAGSMGLHKLAQTPNTSTHVPYIGVFQRTFDGGTRAFEETNSADATTLNPHVIGVISGEDFHVLGPSDANLLVGFDNSVQAFINTTMDLQVSNRLLSEGARINNQLFLEPDEENGIKWDVISRGESGQSQPSIHYDYDSQNLSFVLDKDSTDNIQFNLHNINGVLQNGFINWHEGNFPKNKTLYGDAKIEARGVSQASDNNSFLLLNEEVVYSDSDDSANINGIVQTRGLRLSIFDEMGELLSSDDYDTWADYANADEMAGAIDDMEPTQIGVITSFDSFERKLSLALKNSAYAAGLMKLYNTDEDDRGTPYSAIFHKSGTGTAIELARRGPRSYEVTSENLTDTLNADFQALIKNGTFYVLGETVANSLHAYNGNAKVWVDSNDDLFSQNKILADGGRMRSLLILEQSESNGIAWDDWRDGTFETPLETIDIFNQWSRFSHNTSGNYPASETEVLAWEFDSATESLKCLSNTGTYVGFASAETAESYTLSCEMSSTSGDDDAIGIVIAFVEEDGVEYTLSAIRTQGGITPANGWGVFYNYKQADQLQIETKDIDIARNSAGNGGWAAAGTILSEVRKEGSIVSATTSAHNSVELDISTMIQVDLSSLAVLQKFAGEVKYGVSASSQGEAFISNIVSTAFGGGTLGAGNGAKIYVEIDDEDSAHHLYIRADNICETDQIFIKSGLINLDPCLDSHGVYINGNMVWNKGNLPNTDFLPEGETNLYWDSDLVAKPARAALSVVDNSGIGSLVYDNLTGVFTYDNITNTDALPEGTTNLYYDSDRTSTNAKTTLSVVDNSGIGSLTYDNEAGIITYDNISSTDELPEGTTNLYHTDSRTANIIETIVDSGFIENLSFEYSIVTSANDDGGNIVLTPSDDTKASSTVSIIAGDNISISQAGAEITVTGENGAVYDIIAIDNAVGASLKVSDGDADESEVLLTGSGATTVEYTDAGKITINTPAGATPNDNTITLEAGNGIATGGSFTLNANTGKTITFDHGATSSQASIDNSVGSYIQDIGLDGFGHITSITSAEHENPAWTLTGDSDATGTYIRLSDGTTDTDVLLVGDSTVRITSTQAGTITFAATGGGGGGGETYTAGDGIALIGTEFAVAAGVGLTQETSGLAVDDAQVVLTTEDQNIAGDKTFTSSVIIANNSKITMLGAANVIDITTLTMKKGSSDKFTFNGTTGDFTAAGDVTAYSDERLKSEVKSIDGALDLVNLLRGVTFTKDNVKGLGLIAQEVEKIIPEVVKDGEEYKSIAYGNLVGLLIEAIKELSEKVTKLEEK